LENPVCIDPPDNNFCGTPSFKGIYYRRNISSTTTLGFDMEGLFGLDIINPPPLLIELKHKAPILLKNPIQFSSCAASAGKKCKSCEICNNTKSFKFDCSNVNLFAIGDLKIAFPAVRKCIGITTPPIPKMSSAPSATPTLAPLATPSIAPSTTP
jgi:hypothetical protein